MQLPSTEISNLLPLARDAGKMWCSCHHCDTMFLRFASHVRRRKHNFCGVACRNEGQKVQVHTRCRACGADMLQSPSTAARVVTCSKRCSLARKRAGDPYKHRNSWAWRALRAKVLARQKVCEECGTDRGPWIVLGADPAKVLLWCKKCHAKIPRAAKRQVVWSR